MIRDIFIFSIGAKQSRNFYWISITCFLSQRNQLLHNQTFTVKTSILVSFHSKWWRNRLKDGKCTCWSYDSMFWWIDWILVTDYWTIKHKPTRFFFFSGVCYLSFFFFAAVCRSSNAVATGKSNIYNFTFKLPSHSSIFRNHFISAAPGAPSSASFDVLGPDSFRLSFNSPLNDGGSPVTAYTVSDSIHV